MSCLNLVPGIDETGWLKPGTIVTVGTTVRVEAACLSNVSSNSPASESMLLTKYGCQPDACVKSSSCL